MIISRIIQNGLDLSIETNDIPYQRSANHKIQFVKDPNYSNYSLQAYGKLPKTGYQESEEFKLELEDGNYIKLPSAVFATKGIFQIAISLTGVNGDIINLGIVSYKIRKSFGDSTNILPDNEKAWNSFVHLEVDNYFNNTYQSKLDDFNTKYDDTVTKYNEIVETSTEQLKENIAESKNDAIKQIQSEGQSYQDQINKLQKSEALQDEVLDKLNEEVDLKLTQPYLNNNDSTHITSSDNGSLKNIVVKGNTVQNSTKGLNLLSIYKQTQTVNGITLTYDNDNKVLVANGTANAWLNISLGKFDFKKGVTYKFVGCPKGGSVDMLYHIEPNGGLFFDIGNGVTYMPSEDKLNVAIYFVVCKGVVLNNLVIKPMITTDLNATYDTYEPYTGGQPSPSPEYPQEIKAVNELSGSINAKNLFDFNIIKDSNITKGTAVWTNDSVTITSNSNDCYTESYDKKNYIKVKPNTTYTLLFKRDKSVQGSIYIFEKKNYDDSSYYDLSYDTSSGLKKAWTFTTKSSTNYLAFRLGIYSSGQTCTFSEIMLVEGSHTWDNISYENGKQSLLNYTLQNPLYKLGDVYDYIDVNKGKIVRNVGVVTFDGSDDEDWLKSNLDNALDTRVYTIKSDMIVPTVNNQKNIAVCNKYHENNYTLGQISDNESMMVYTNNAIEFKDDTYGTDLATWKSFLNQNPITVVYQLATPVEEPLPSDLQTLLQSLKTYYPQTNIMFDTEVEPYINFDYKLNLKSWIEDKDNKEIEYDKQNKEKDKYSSTFFENMFALQRTGKIYTVKFPKWETSHISTGEKLDANAGLVCEPSTKTIKGQNDYANIPLFKTYDVNAYVDDEGIRHVTAIKGDKDFKDEGKVDVFVLGMSYYEKVWSDDQYWYYSRTDSPRDGYTIARECVNRDGSIQAFGLYAKYVAGNIDGNLYSSKGLKPARYYGTTPLPANTTNTNTSYSGLISQCHKRGSFYSGGMTCDYKYILTTFYLKYGTLNTQSIMGGCNNYSAQYEASIKSSTNNTYFPLTKAQADYFPVGASVSIGYKYGGSNLDRYYSTVSIYADNVKIIKKVALDDSNTALYLDTNTPFNTANTSSGAVFCSAMHWRSGFSDDILGRDGCPCDTKSELTNGKFPIVIQGIECMVGGYETYGNAFMDIVDATGKREVYIQNDASQLTTDIATAKSTYKKSPYAIQPTLINSWNYITKIDFDLANGAFIQTNSGQSGSSTGSGFADGLYVDGASSGQREFLGFGSLGNGSAAGLSYLRADDGVGSANWRILARLSINGVGGELTA